ncbi:MAG: TonB family protein [Bacteroidia bacterium]|nr:TonB family protein [Bacteroidia bacterium]
MKLSFLLLFFTIPFLCSSQKKIFLDNDNEWTSKSAATQYGIVTKESRNTIKVEFYTLQDTLKGWEYYSTYGKRRKVKDGLARYLYSNGTDSLVCVYAEDKCVGQSVSYYPNAQKNTILHYKDGLLNGFLIQYYPSGKLRRKEKYEDGNCLGGQLFNEEGSELPFEPYLIQAEFPGGIALMDVFLSKIMEYPIPAIESGLQGRVLIDFIIEKDGTMTSVRVRKSVSRLLDDEAVRVIKQMAETIKWTPGKVDGKIVRIKYTQPVVFRL